MKNKLIGAIAFLASLALLFSPTQVILPKIPLTLSDLLLVVAFLLLIILFILDKERAKLLPELPVVLFVVAAFLSVIAVVANINFNNFFHVGADEAEMGVQSGIQILTAFALEFFKYILYLLIGVAVFKCAFKSDKWKQVSIILLTISIGLAVMFASYQRYHLNYIEVPSQRTVVESNDSLKKAFTTIETPVAVGSTFGAWSDKGFHGGFIPYACFLALALPFLLYLALKKPLWWVLTAPILILSGYSILAGRMVPAILVGLLVTAFVYSKKAGIITTGIILVYVALLAFIPSVNRVQVLCEPYNVMISTADAEHYQNGTKHLKKFFSEGYAAINLIRGTGREANTGLFGVGLSLYQDNIQEGYSTLGETTNQRLHLGEYSVYTFTLASLGILGLVALIYMYWHYFKSALVLKRAESKISAPILGSIIALIILSFTAMPFMRGEGIIIAAILGLIENQKQQIGDRG